MSDAKPVHEVLADVMADVRAVRKAQENAEGGYVFRGIDTIVNAVGPVLRTHRVAVVPHAVDARYRDIRAASGRPSRECTVLVTYRVHGPAGDHLDVQAPGEAMDYGDKGTAKAMSVAWRIALFQMLALPTGDPDADGEIHERGDVLDADALRRQIRQSAAAQKVSVVMLAADFLSRTGEDFGKTSKEDVLNAYLNDFREHGIRPARKEMT